MKKRNKIIAAFLGFAGVILAVAVAAQQKVLNADVFVDGIYHSVASTVFSAPYAGQLWVTYDTTTQPELQIYDHVGAVWNEVPTKDDAETVSANWTFGTATTAVPPQVGTLTLNSLVTKTIFFEDFSTACAVGVEGTSATPVTTDAAVHEISCPNSGLVFLHRNEVTNTIATYETFGGSLDVSGDITNNDGASYVFTEMIGTGPVKVATTATYIFQADVLVTDISAIDGAWWFGWRKAAAWANPPADPATGAWFTLSDNAGDLDVECQVGGGGVDNTDGVTTWADGETKTLAIVVENGGGYVFYLDGTAIAATNCDSAGTHEAADNDYLQPMFQYTQGAEGAATGMTIDNIKLGVVVQ